MKLDHSTETLIHGLPEADYHAMKALAASGAWTLAEECQAKFLWNSPWNPTREPEHSPEFDIGTAAHLAVLEPARQAERIALIDAANYRGGKAQEARDAARAEGKVPLLPHQAEIVGQIAGAIREHPIAGEAFTGGDPEVTMLWRDAGTEVPCKARVDYLPRHARWMCDLKTAVSANPRHWRDQAFRLGYHARAAWYLDGAEAVLGRRPEEYWFIIVEKEAPWLVSVCTFDDQALEWGRLANRRACDLFRHSIASQDWPGYREPGSNRDRAFRVSLPNWAIFQLGDRFEAGEYQRAERPSPQILRAAQKLFSPSPEA